MFTRETASVARHCHRDGETTASHRASAAPDSAQPDMTTACGFGRAGRGRGQTAGGGGGQTGVKVAHASLGDWVLSAHTRLTVVTGGVSPRCRSSPGSGPGSVRVLGALGVGKRRPHPARGGPALCFASQARGLPGR